MYFKVHADRIEMEDDNGKMIAEIDYPKVREGVREITHIYGSDSREGINNAMKLMDLAASEIRKNNEKVIATNAFASSWFADRPNQQDLLYRTEYVIKNKSEESSESSSEAGKKTSILDRLIGKDEEEEAPEEDAVYSAGNGTRGNTGRLNGTKAQNSRGNTGRLNGASTQNSRGNTGWMNLQNDGSDAPQAGGRRNGRTTERVVRKVRTIQETGRKAGGGFAPINGISNILRFLSVLCMAVITLLFAVEALLQKGGIASNFQNGGSDLIYAVMAVTFFIFCLIQVFWTMSRKAYQTGSGLIRIDSGRGIFGFIIILIIACICKSITYFVPTQEGAFAAMLKFADAFDQYGTGITLLSIVGIAFCIVRKFLRR